MDVTYFRTVQKQPYSDEKVDMQTLTVPLVWPSDTKNTDKCIRIKI